MTEANFGNDDETMGRLEDMGIPGGGPVGADVSRQKSDSAQRRRQVSVHVFMLCQKVGRHQSSERKERKVTPFGVIMGASRPKGSPRTAVIRFVMQPHCLDPKLLQ